VWKSRPKSLQDKRAESASTLRDKNVVIADTLHCSMKRKGMHQWTTGWRLDAKRVTQKIQRFFKKPRGGLSSNLWRLHCTLDWTSKICCTKTYKTCRYSWRIDQILAAIRYRSQQIIQVASEEVLGELDGKPRNDFTDKRMQQTKSNILHCQWIDCLSLAWSDSWN